MAVTTAECEDMIESARSAKVKLMIAYRLHFEEGNLAAIDALRRGKIGEPRIFQSTFCQQVTPQNTRLKAKLGGGPLYDIGVYCVNAARYLFRAEPQEVFGYKATGRDRRFSQVEEMDAAVLRFPGDRLASFVCSFGAADRSTYEVVGTKGSLKMDPGYEMIGDLKLSITIDGKSKEQVYKKRDQFAPELDYFSNCVLKNIEPEPDGIEGLADIRVINALQESIRSSKPVKVPALQKQKWPEPAQEIHKPAVPEPELVRAASPSQ
jgi:glucose-fructose oxidoreductase